MYQEPELLDHGRCFCRETRAIRTNGMSEELAGCHTSPHGSHAHFVVEVMIIAPLMLFKPIAMIVRLQTMRIVLGAVVYFLSVMVAGFALGMVREFIFVPAVGRGMGEPLEAPFMLAAIAMSAWIATGWCQVPTGARHRLAMGVLSLALVLAAELGLSPFVRGSVKAWFDSFTPLTLALALVLWAAHAAMPALVRR